MAPPPAPPPKRRARTEAQLNQKRLTDRIKHKENRQENKQRLERLEVDIASIKTTLESLALHLQNVPRALTTPTAVLPLHNPPPVSINPLWTHQPYSHTALPPTQLWSSTNNATRIWGYAPSQTGSSRILDCRCGSQHPDQFDCLEQCNVTALYRGHVPSLSPDRPVSAAPTSPFPRNPSLPSMMLHQVDENILTFFITGFLQQCKTKSIEQLLGFYLLGYRYMRWQMDPDRNTIQDIPSWMLPTEAQKAFPHSVVVDYLPWPRLRDYICTSDDSDPRHSIQFYFESIQLRWPPDCPLFAQSETGQIILSPEFERVVFEIENWSLGPPWSDAFPHLMHLIQV